MGSNGGALAGEGEVGVLVSPQVEGGKAGGGNASGRRGHDG